MTLWDDLGTGDRDFLGRFRCPDDLKSEGSPIALTVGPAIELPIRRDAKRVEAELSSGAGIFAN